MKKILFISFLFVSPLHAKQIVLDIPDNDIRIVENDVIDAEQWIRDAWAGKLAKCKSRLVKAEIERAVKEEEPIPAGEDAIVDQVLSSKDFISRKDREEQIQAQKEP